MQLKFTQRWRGFRSGDIGDMPDGAATVLIKRGVAVEEKQHKKRRKKPFIDDVPEGVETV